MPYLGHMITTRGLGVQEAKVEALKRISIPRDVSRWRAFIGPANYYRRFVCGFSLLAKPLTRLTRANQEWMWGLDQERAFEALKRALGSVPVLRWLDARRSFQLHIDWSMLGIGVVLT
jgi:hypothetical protein